MQDLVKDVHESASICLTNLVVQDSPLIDMTFFFLFFSVVDMLLCDSYNGAHNYYTYCINFSLMSVY